MSTLKKKKDSSTLKEYKEGPMKIAIIGCGNMGSALARHLSKGASLILCDRGKEKGSALAKEIGAQFVEHPVDAIKQADWVILAIKPKDLAHLAPQLELTEKQTLFSILSGATIATLKKLFGKPSIIRMMPNTAVSIGKGIIGFAEEGKTSENKKQEIEKMFSSLGVLYWIPENKMDAFAALAASSPAFGFLIIEAMMNAGVSLGFSAQQSKEIVMAMFEGCIALLRASPHKHPAELKLQITSPGGTTIEGIYALEAGGIRKAIFDAMTATHQKGIRMSHE